METLFSVVVSNLLVAGLLAVVAWLVGRSGRRPVLAHALWVLVLVKLVTPPLVRIPLPLPAVSAATTPAEPTPPPSFDGEREPLPEVDAEHVLALDRFVLLDTVPEEVQVAETPPPAAPSWATLCLVARLVGSDGYMALALWRPR